MNHFNRCWLLLLTISLAACGPAQSPANAYIIPTGTPIAPLGPQVTPTAYYSAPRDGSLDTACRITINLFFSYKKGFSAAAYRSLFVPASQGLADIQPPAEALTLLKLIPESQWWQQAAPGTPIPGTMLPDEPNEYFYYVEFTGHYEPDTTPVFTYPDGMSMIMIGEGTSICRIKGYGKG